MDSHNRLAIEFKQRAQHGEKLFGVWQTLFSPAAAKMLARTKLDFVVIDGEHEPINPETLPIVLEQYAQATVLPFVRVAWNEVVLVKQALDGGARALMFPMINSAAEAERAVSYCYYPPRGIRGIGPSAASNLYDDLQPYLETIGDAITIWVQIEHIDAVRAAEAIANVPGIDGLFIGPADLSASLGKMMQFDDDEVQQAIEEVIAVGRRTGKTVAMAVDDTPEKIIQRLRQGIQAATIGDDRAFIRMAAQFMLDAIHIGLAL
jgi:2-keto-3-deoxy-L-rhamnonate aldolase RhmA